MSDEVLRVRTAEVSWHVVRVGPVEGPPILLVHGFPEDWRSWRRQLTALGGSAFNVHAVDLPGIGRSGPPSSYRIEHVSALLSELSTSLDPDGVHLVGHDWGAILSAAAATSSPQAFRSVTLSGAPHPAAFRKALRSPRQLARSWYVAAFQLPGAPLAVGAAGAAAARWLFRVPPAIRGTDEARRALAYYRQNLGPTSVVRRRDGRITPPALVIQGAGDRYTGLEVMAETARRCDDLRGFHVVDCGHFVHQERPDAFNDLLLRFVTSVEAAGAPR